MKKESCTAYSTGAGIVGHLFVEPTREIQADSGASTMDGPTGTMED
jgi:hypothetical protein